MGSKSAKRLDGAQLPRFNRRHEVCSSFEKFHVKLLALLFFGLPRFTTYNVHERTIYAYPRLVSSLPTYLHFLFCLSAKSTTFLFLPNVWYSPAVQAEKFWVLANMFSSGIKAQPPSVTGLQWFFSYVHWTQDLIFSTVNWSTLNCPLRAKRALFLPDYSK